MKLTSKTLVVLSVVLTAALAGKLVANSLNQPPAGGDGGQPATVQCLCCSNADPYAYPGSIPTTLGVTALFESGGYEFFDTKTASLTRVADDLHEHEWLGKVTIPGPVNGVSREIRFRFYCISTGIGGGRAWVLWAKSYYGTGVPNTWEFRSEDMKVVNVVFPANCFASLPTFMDLKVFEGTLDESFYSFAVYPPCP